MLKKDDRSKKDNPKGKRITTVPLFDSTKKMMERNKKIVSLVSNK